MHRNNAPPCSIADRWRQSLLRCSSPSHLHREWVSALLRPSYKSGSPLPRRRLRRRRRGTDRMSAPRRLRLSHLRQGQLCRQPLTRREDSAPETEISHLVTWRGYAVGRGILSFSRAYSLDPIRRPEGVSANSSRQRACGATIGGLREPTKLGDSSGSSLGAG